MFDKNELLKIIPKERVAFGGEIEKDFLTDGLKRNVGSADALVFLNSAEETSAIIKYANKNKIAITPRGAGTNLVGSTVPNGGIVLDFSKMNKILELDEETLTATVEPGILLSDFQAFVESKGLFYPPDPGEKQSSIGGNISTNAGGMRAVKYGVTRDYVRGLEIVTADGKIVKLGGKTEKDASGLSLKNLIIGSEGTLAVITKCVLKLIAKPEKSLNVLVPFSDFSKGIQSVQKILKAGANPTAVEFIERKVVNLGAEFTGIDYPHPEASCYILLLFDGTETEVEQNSKRIEKIVLENGAIDYISLSASEAVDVWKVRGCLVKAVEAFSEQEPMDIVVPINKITDYIDFVNNLEKESGVKMIAFGHAGDGNVHLCILRENRSDDEWKTELDKVLEKLYSKAYNLGGLTSGEHGIGLSKRKYFLEETEDENIAIMNSIKTALDPNRIFNNGKSYTL